MSRSFVGGISLFGAHGKGKERSETFEGRVDRTSRPLPSYKITRAERAARDDDSLPARRQILIDSRISGDFTKGRCHTKDLLHLHRLAHAEDVEFPAGIFADNQRLSSDPFSQLND